MKMMTTKITVLSALALLIFSALQCFPVKADADEIYVWKDEQGRIHATDRPPPDETQIIETFQPSVSPSIETNSPQKNKENKTGYWEAIRRAEEAEKKAKSAQEHAKTLGEKEAAALRTAKEAEKEAEKYMKWGGSKSKRRWARREAEKYIEQAKQAKAQAEKLTKQKTAAIRKQKIAEAKARQAKSEASRLSP